MRPAAAGSSSRIRGSGGSGSSGGGGAAGHAKLLQYEVFLVERLRPDLQAAEAQRAKRNAELREWEELQENLLSLQQSGSAEAGFKAQVPLGSGVYCQAAVPRADEVCVAVGLGFHVQAPLGDAVRIAELRRGAAKARADAAAQEVVRLRSHIRLVEEGMWELQQQQQQQGFG